MVAASPSLPRATQPLVVVPIICETTIELRARLLTPGPTLSGARFVRGQTFQVHRP
jgi:hypothetical protein